MARPSLAISRCTETPTSPRLLLTNVHAPKGQSHQLNIILHAGQEGGQGLVTQDPGPAWKGGPMLRAALGVFLALLQAHSVLGHGAALCTGEETAATTEAGARVIHFPQRPQPWAASALSRLTSCAPARLDCLSALSVSPSPFSPLPAMPTPTVTVSFKLQFKCHFAHRPV